MTSTKHKSKPQLDGHISSVDLDCYLVIQVSSSDPVFMVISTGYYVYGIANANSIITEFVPVVFSHMMLIDPNGTMLLMMKNYLLQVIC